MRSCFTIYRVGYMYSVYKVKKCYKKLEDKVKVDSI